MKNHFRSIRNEPAAEAGASAKSARNVEGQNHRHNPRGAFIGKWRLPVGRFQTADVPVVVAAGAAIGIRFDQRTEIVSMPVPVLEIPLLVAGVGLSRPAEQKANPVAGERLKDGDRFLQLITDAGDDLRPHHLSAAHSIRVRRKPRNVNSISKRSKKRQIFCWFVCRQKPFEDR
jgi:hypothetical protein